MAVDMFMKISGIQGESPDDKHKNEIDVLSWSWGVSQTGSFQTGGGGGAGKASFSDLSFTKWVDVASPLLMLYTASGEHITDATLVVRKAGGKAPLEYIKIVMKKVMVTSVSTGGSSGEDRLTENVTLNFAEVNVDYVKQKEDGSGEAPKQFKWDIAANKKL